MKLTRPDLIEFLQRLVGAPSPSGGEKAVVQEAAAEMERLGFDEVTIDGNGSLIGIIHGAHPGPTLLLDAHCDTVGVAEGAPWSRETYGGTIDNGRIYGRGTSDMKGALAAMLHAAAGVARMELTGRVTVSATVMEEVMEGVALRSVMSLVQPDFVVIGEATELNLNIGGRGRAEIILEALGKPAHSSSPYLGDNAVHRMIPAIRAIERMTFPADPLLGPALMVLTDIISDPYPGHSVIPSRCRITYDRRTLPGESMDSVLADLRALPEMAGIRASIAHGEHETYTGTTLSGPKFFPAWKLEPDHPFVQASLAGLRAAGLDPQLSAYRFCTNAAYSAGWAGVPTVGFGPSAEGQAHVVDEYIEIEQLVLAAEGYRKIIEAIL
ncbi:MAG: YgeY family selenium metabolism-linked hydrolase [Caldilineales bacterium]|nr:YgeY family selenium metabolism-linked hydrolase [Caldilineales bacterium]